MPVSDPTRKVNPEPRPLRDEEIDRLIQALGKPIDREFLKLRLRRTIRDVVRASSRPTARELRDDLLKVAREGKAWLQHIDNGPSASLLRATNDLEPIKSIVLELCERAESQAKEVSGNVQRGRGRSPFPLNVFLSNLVGYAKRAGVYPRVAARGLRSQTAPRPAPAFFTFVETALAVARDVIQSSEYSESQREAALAVLDVKNETTLSKILERVRGRIADYHESGESLSEWKPKGKHRSARDKPRKVARNWASSLRN